MLIPIRKSAPNQPAEAKRLASSASAGSIDASGAAAVAEAPSELSNLAPSSKAAHALAAHAEAVWKNTVAYAANLVPEGSPEIAAALILRLARDVEVVRYKDRREVPERLPALQQAGPFLDHKGREFKFNRVIEEAHKLSPTGRYSLVPRDGELIVRSVGHKWHAKLGALVPEPWYSTLVTIGNEVTSSRGLDRYNYHVKITIVSQLPNGVMETRFRKDGKPLGEGECRFFTGSAEKWRELEARS